jgi:hypothetical protein
MFARLESVPVQEAKLFSPPRFPCSIYSFSLSTVRELLSVLKGNTIKITAINVRELGGLREKFCLSQLSAIISRVPFLDGLQRCGSTRGIAALEEKANQHDSVITVLTDKVAQRSTGSHFL